jgi:hypothetical protein
MSGRCETDVYPPCRTVVTKDSTEGAEVQNRLKQFRHLYVGDGADPGQYTRFIHTPPFLVIDIDAITRHGVSSFPFLPIQLLQLHDRLRRERRNPF